MFSQHTFITKLFVLFLFTAFSITAYAAPGDLDSSFGNGGKVVTPIGTKSSDTALASALQTDGKIVMAGSSLSDNQDFSEQPANITVARVNPNGSLDTSFGLNGEVVKQFQQFSRAFAVLIQPDGKILVGGVTRTFINPQMSTTNYFLMMRLNSNGSFDNSFGTNGIVKTDFGASSYLYTLALQSDGKIIGAGLVGNSMGVARYNTDGTLDTSFNGNGYRVITINAGSSRAYTAQVQPDGKIVLGGTSTANGVASFTIVRLNPDGSFDNTFDGDGQVTTSPLSGTGNTVWAIRIQPDGKIVAAGNNSNGINRAIAVVRYNTNGSLDTSFDADGIVVIQDANDNAVNDLNLQSDGKIVLGGNIYVANSTTYHDFLSVRFNTDGSFDSTFNGNGKVVIPIPNTDEYGHNSLIQPDGKIIVTGYSEIGFTKDSFSLARLNINGSLDTSFDGDGVSIIELGNSRDVVFRTAIQPDGKIIAAGYSFDGRFQNLSLARYNSNGSLDTTFGNQGKVIMPFTDSNSEAGELAVQPDGKIVVVGVVYQVDQTTSNSTVVRYNSDGSLDSSFGTAGIATVQIPNTTAYRLVLQADGKIIIGGGVAFARLNANGSLDSSFGSGGIVTAADPNRENFIGSLTLQSDGKIIGVGYSRPQSGDYLFLVSRYNPNGSLDTTFGGTGTVYTSITNFAIATAVKVQADNKIVAAGYYSDGYILTRYNPDGSLDSSFDGDGKVTTLVRTAAYNPVTALAIQQNGKLLITGYDATADESTATIFRYNADGSLNSTFGSGGKIFQSIGGGKSAFNALSLQNDGKIIAGGYSSNGANDDFTLVRYQGDATAVSNRTLFDFDGDGKSDISVFRPENGAWYLNQSSAGFTGVTFGFGTDKLVPADYDGDGKTDVAVFRGGVWYLQRSTQGFYGVAFGNPDDIPVPADYDGDGKADVAVFRPSNGTWYLLRSQLGFTGTAFGQNGDKPVPADYDGDGKADIAVNRTGTWYINRSQLGFYGVQFGDSNDKLVPADYDGDGKADVAVFRPSNGVWYIQRSQLGFSGIAFGFGTDVPAPADYDGDGKADLAVFRNGTWYLQKSSAGFTGVAFGASTDSAVPNAFVR